jgi:sugar phosphate isomerase/epimerase
MSIPVILSTGSLFNFDIDTAMALASEAGFDGIELMVDWRRETYQVEHLQKLMSRHQLPILAIHSPFAKMFMPDWPRDPVESIQKSVQLAETLGARTVVVHPPERWLRFQALMISPNQARKLSLPLPVISPGRLGRWLREELPAFQAQTEVKVAVENMPCRRLGPFKLEPHHFHTPQMLNQFQHLTLDTTHVGTRETDLLAFHRQVEARVAHIHLSNFNGKEHQLLHNGVLPLAALLQRLAQQAFAGLVSLELSPSSLHVEDEAQLRHNLKASLVFCREALAAKIPANEADRR